MNITMPMTAEQNRLVYDTFQIMSFSEYHKTWSEQNIETYILSPLKHNKLLVQYDALDNPIAFCTYAFLSPEAEKRYMADSGSLTEMDFASNDGTLWCVDFAAPFGGCRQVIRQMRIFFEETYGEGTKARIFRTRKNRYGWMIA